MTTDNDLRFDIITVVVTRAECLTGEALMSLLYLAQVLRGVPLGYVTRRWEFDPLPIPVMEADLAFVAKMGWVQRGRTIGPYGAEYRPGKLYAHYVGEEYAPAIDWIVETFGSRPPEDLVTIRVAVYVDRELHDAGRVATVANLTHIVRKRQPLCGSETIAAEVRRLADAGLLLSVPQERPAARGVAPDDISTLRLATIAALAARSGRITSRGVMLFLYLLQTLRGVPLGYDFSLHIYGPHSQEVESDIAHAVDLEWVRKELVRLPGGYHYAYAADARPGAPSLSAEHAAAVGLVVKTFGRRPPPALLVVAVIIFCDRWAHETGKKPTVAELMHTVWQALPLQAGEITAAEFARLADAGLLLSVPQVAPRARARPGWARVMRPPLLWDMSEGQRRLCAELDRMRADGA